MRSFLIPGARILPYLGERFGFCHLGWRCRPPSKVDIHPRLIYSLPRDLEDNERAMFLAPRDLARNARGLFVFVFIFSATTSFTTSRQWNGFASIIKITFIGDFDVFDCAIVCST